jgi:hypothetical protein
LEKLKIKMWRRMENVSWQIVAAERVVEWKRSVYLWSTDVR